MGYIKKALLEKRSTGTLGQKKKMDMFFYLEEQLDTLGEESIVLMRQ